MIKFKWERGDQIHIFDSFDKLIKELRSENVDEYNELSDEFLINESYILGEWDYQKQSVSDKLQELTEI